MHIVPYDGIGGVETAARSMHDGAREGFDFAKLYIADKSAHTGGAGGAGGAGGPKYASENDPRAYLQAFWALWKARPQVVIASLWRSCALLLALKLLRPSTRAVTFLHLPADVHAVDRLLNRAAMMLSTQIWADSRATLEARVPRRLRHRGRVISFLVQRQPEPAYPPVPTPSFIFWGRLHPQKGLARGLRLFALVRSSHPEAQLHLVGPDQGELSALRQQATEAGLGDAVHFRGPLPRAEIFALARTCSFYLQTSVDEGMGMSVIEAMQLGLVPVVTAVGEIGSYCSDGHNAVVIGSDDKAARRIDHLLADPGAYAALARAAYETWQTRSLYHEDMAQACSSLLAPSPP